jgi:hypothetical protein
MSAPKTPVQLFGYCVALFGNRDEFSIEVYDWVSQFCRFFLGLPDVMSAGRPLDFDDLGGAHGFAMDSRTLGLKSSFENALHDVCDPATG